MINYILTDISSSGAELVRFFPRLVCFTHPAILPPINIVATITQSPASAATMTEATVLITQHKKCINFCGLYVVKWTNIIMVSKKLILEFWLAIYFWLSVINKSSKFETATGLR